MLGIVGLFLPVMPTTVFLLGAAACYSRASGRFYNRLLNNRIFGPVIADWRHHRAMTVRAKATAIAFTVVGIGASVLFWVDRLWLRLILLGIAIAVSAFLLSIKTRR
ncbi:MAG: YbaN family protein [Gemmatimonadales bacterium]|nr:YbaN family protein [Gemmatimonadales bacterium]